MQLTISCEAFSRMAEIGRHNMPDLEDYFKSLYFERHNNQLYMIGCNRAIIAIEHLGINVGPNEHCAIDVRNDHLIKQCDDAKPFNGQLEIIANNDLRYTSVKTTMGWNAPNCFVELPKDHKFAKWRELIPDALPKKTNGAMHWSAALIYTLGVASPSGQLSFPEFIDVTQPVLINDAEAENWIALFMPTRVEGPGLPARIPTWVNEE